MNLNELGAGDNVFKSQNYRQQYGLLTNDSFIPVFMEKANTINLASADQAFAAIPGINLFSPSDINIK